MNFDPTKDRFSPTLADGLTFFQLEQLSYEYNSAIVYDPKQRLPKRRSGNRERSQLGQYLDCVRFRAIPRDAGADWLA